VYGRCNLRHAYARLPGKHKSRALVLPHNTARGPEGRHVTTAPRTGGAVSLSLHECSKAARRRTFGSDDRPANALTLSHTESTGAKAPLPRFFRCFELDSLLTWRPASGSNSLSFRPITCSRASSAAEGRSCGLCWGCPSGGGRRSARFLPGLRLGSFSRITTLNRRTFKESHRRGTASSNAALRPPGCCPISRQNTFTGRLTEQMLDEVLESANRLASG